MRNIVKYLIQNKKFVGSNLIKINIIFMIIFILNIIIGFDYMGHSFQDNYQKVRQSADLRIQLLNLEKALVDQETGQRGFLLSKDSQFLKPFDQGTEDYIRASEALLKNSENIEENPNIHQDIVRLIETGQRWKVEYGDPQVRKVMAGGTITEKELLRGKQSFDTFRDQEAELMKYVEVLRDDRREDMLNRLYYLFAIIGAIFIGIQFFMLYVLQSGLTRITRPIIELDDAVSSYQSGHIQAKLPQYTEQNEIGRLISKFEMMSDEMKKERRTIKETYRMINMVNQARNLEEVYRISLESVAALIPCDRVSIITQNDSRHFSIKAFIQSGMFTHKDIPLTREAIDIYDLLRSGFSMVHADWTTYRAEGPITDQLYENGIRSSMHIILRKETRVVGLLNLFATTVNHFSLQDKEQLELLSPMIVTAMDNAVETNRIQEMALHDALTGLWNRRYFEVVLEKLIKQYKQEDLSTTFSLILLDVDRFKVFNDTWGHSEGDLVLKHLAKLLEFQVRPSDIPVRYGGEEFAILLPHTPNRGGVEVAERIRKQLEIESPSRKYTVTASFGVAEWQEGLTAAELIEAADQALYQAKEAGRNQVIAYPKS